MMSLARSWYCFFGTLLLAMVCLILAAPANVFAEESVTANPEAVTNTCKGLKPYNNLDELLYQFYINLDSDCLYEMPEEELEKIWDTKILSNKRVKRGEGSLNFLRTTSDFQNKPYNAEKDAFYIEIKSSRIVGNSHLNQFDIIVTTEYFEKHATLFPEGNFPKLLPEPIITSKLPVMPRPVDSEKSIKKPKKRGELFPPLFNYFWMNYEKKHKIILNGYYGITSVNIE